MGERKGLPLLEPDFHALRESGRVYVDKTDLIARLVSDHGCVFLSRPERFGKSLLVSTLASLFRHGIRDFSGLAIERLWHESAYPVVELDFSTLSPSCGTEPKFRKALQSHLAARFSGVGFSYARKTPITFFDQLSNFLRSRPVRSLVVLIDGYDHPLALSLGNGKLLARIQSLLADFFSILKGNAGVLRFLFVTGVTKYRQTGVFSGLNNLVDISLDLRYGTLLGYTDEELRGNFGPHIDRALRAVNERRAREGQPGLSREGLLSEMRRTYGGFSFDGRAQTHVHSPGSVLHFLSRPEDGFRNYWLRSSGVDAWIVHWLEQGGGFRLEDCGGSALLRPFDLDGVESPASLSANALLYQIGCLSGKAAVGDNALLVGCPNAEVAESMGMPRRDCWADQAVPKKIGGQARPHFREDSDALAGADRAAGGRCPKACAPGKT